MEKKGSSTAKAGLKPSSKLAAVARSEMATRKRVREECENLIRRHAERLEDASLGAAAAGTKATAKSPVLKTHSVDLLESWCVLLVSEGILGKDPENDEDVCALLELASTSDLWKCKVCHEAALRICATLFPVDTAAAPLRVGLWSNLMGRFTEESEVLRKLVKEEQSKRARKGQKSSKR